VLGRGRHPSCTAHPTGYASNIRRFGVVVSVVLEAVARANRRGAFVEMETSAEAVKAIAALNLSDVDGRRVSVYLALATISRSS
jgi:hypothetical protein